MTERQLCASDTRREFVDEAIMSVSGFIDAVAALECSSISYEEGQKSKTGREEARRCI